MAGTLGAMALERRTIGRLPSAATGRGRAGPRHSRPGARTPGPAATGWRTGTIGPLGALADRRRLVLVNRRAELPRGMTMAEMAAEHADAIRTGSGRRSTWSGRRRAAASPSSSRPTIPTSCGPLVLLSTACRLGPEGRCCSAGSRRGSARARIARRWRSWPPSSCRAGAGVPAGVVASVAGPLVLRDGRASTTWRRRSRRRTPSTWRPARARSRRARSSSPAARTASTRRAVRGDGAAHPGQRPAPARRQGPHHRARRRALPRRAGVLALAETIRGPASAAITTFVTTASSGRLRHPSASRIFPRRTAAGRRRGTPCARPGPPTAGGRPPGGSPRRDSRRARARSR